MQCCRIVNGIKNKNIKKQPWGNVECFAFGGATVRFASLETSFHAANHTIPPPPSHEGYPHGPKDKNRSPFHGEKPLMIKYFLGKKLNLPILNGRDAILRVRVKWLIFNMVLQLWADVKYHVPTRFGFSPKASGFYPWGKAHSRTAKCEAFHVAPRLFFMFLFLIPFTVRQQCRIYPQ